MIKKLSILVGVVLLAAMALPTLAQCNGCSGKRCKTICMPKHKKPYLGVAQERASHYNWHGNYNHSAYGQPIALVVPPTAELQTNWSWGAPSSRISRIDHQFGRDYPGPGAFGGGPYRNTPMWPADTAQFGVYYVRAPWYPTQR